MSEPRENLIGDNDILDHVAQKYHRQEDLPHPLQKKIGELIESQLTDDEQEVFYLRYGERMTIRGIAERLGYSSHQVIQAKIERIQHKIKEGLNGLI